MRKQFKNWSLMLFSFELIRILLPISDLILKWKKNHRAGYKFIFFNVKFTRRTVGRGWAKYRDLSRSVQLVAEAKGCTHLQNVCFTRNIGMGTSTAAARVGAFCSPYIVYLVRCCHTVVTYLVCSEHGTISDGSGTHDLPHSGWTR